MKHLVNSILLACLLAGCSSVDPTGDLMLMDNEGVKNGSSILQDEDELSNQSTVNQIQYSIDILSALEYVNRRGEEPDPGDVDELRKESVLILEMESMEKIQEIFESSRIQMDKEDAIKYLIGEITSDIVLTQGENEYLPTAVQYDGMVKNKFRLFLFYKDVDVRAGIRVSYYDRLFGAGLIQLKHT